MHFSSNGVNTITLVPIDIPSACPYISGQGQYVILELILIREQSTLSTQK